MTLRNFVTAGLVGLGATLMIDLWALVLKRGFNIPSLSYCLLGRWILHMPGGTFVHRSIGAAEQKRLECATGWIAHYSIGTAFALMFVFLLPSWLERPTLLPALAFGIVTTVVPFFVMQPSLGLGFAASKTPKPNQARLKSLMTHAVFGLGLWFWAACAPRPDYSLCYSLARGAWDTPPEPALAGKPGEVLRLLMSAPPATNDSLPATALLAMVGADSGAWWTPTADSLIVAVSGITIHIGGPRARRSGSVVTEGSRAELTARRIPCE